MPNRLRVCLSAGLCHLSKQAYLCRNVQAMHMPSKIPCSNPAAHSLHQLAWYVCERARRGALMRKTSHVVQFAPKRIMIEYTNTNEPGVWISIIGMLSEPTSFLSHVRLICG